MTPTTALHVITALTSLAVFQAVLNAALVSLIVLLVVEPKQAGKLRKWMGRP